MDEPTNHLDFDTVEALGHALERFQGTLIVVSHDRSFLKRISKQILEIRDGHVYVFPGTYDDYLWSLEKGALSLQLSADKNKAKKWKAGVIVLVFYHSEVFYLRKMISFFCLSQQIRNLMH